LPKTWRKQGEHGQCHETYYLSSLKSLAALDLSARLLDPGAALAATSVGLASTVVNADEEEAEAQESGCVLLAVNAAPAPAEDTAN